MATLTGPRSPSIACISIIGRHNNPLHISLFPATGPGYEAERDHLEYSFMLNSSLDIFDARMPTKTVGHDFGLLHALDERIAMYGWITNTGVKLVIVVDMEGRTAPTVEAGKTAILGLRTSDLTSAFQALQTAYIRLLRNPFYMPDEHDPKLARDKPVVREITSPRFIKEIERIGNTWQPDMERLQALVVAIRGSYCQTDEVKSSASNIDIMTTDNAHEPWLEGLPPNAQDWKV